MKKAVTLVLIVVIGFGVWHLHSASRIAAALQGQLEETQARGVFEVAVNPFSNRGVFTFAAGAGPPDGVDAASLEADMATAARARVVVDKDTTDHTWAGAAVVRNGATRKSRRTVGYKCAVFYYRAAVVVVHCTAVGTAATQGHVSRETTVR